MKWKNWYRARKPGSTPDYANCTMCGHREQLTERQLFSNHHCGQDGDGFVSKAEAEEYAPRIYPMHEYLGAFPVGKSPAANAPAVERAIER